MGNFAVVLCQGEIPEPIKKNGIIKRLVLFFKRIFVDSVSKIETVKYELFENVDLFTINLPCRIDELSMLNKKETDKYISNFIIQNNISSCIIPDKLVDKLNFKSCNGNTYNKNLLFFSLLRIIIEMIYKKQKKNLYELDITIISGDNNDNLRVLIEYIAPHVKYLTVVKSTGENNIFDIDELLNDYGLSARVTDNIKGALKDAQIVVNLGEIDDNLLSSLKVNPDCAIINYGKIAGKGFREGIMINGINVSLPEAIDSKLGNRLIEYFSATELSEIIICQKLSIHDEFRAGQISSANMNRILKEFRTGKFFIKSFTGRHGPVNINEF